MYLARVLFINERIDCSEATFDKSKRTHCYFHLLPRKFDGVSFSVGQDSTAKKYALMTTSLPSGAWNWFCGFNSRFPDRNKTSSSTWALKLSYLFKCPECPFFCVVWNREINSILLHLNIAYI